MRRLLRSLGLLVGALALGIPGLGAYLAPRLRAELAGLLSDRTGRDVEIGSLAWSWRPGLEFRGERLRIGPRPGRDEADLLTLGSFRVVTTLRDVLRSPRRLRTVEVRTLSVQIPGRSPAPAAPEPGGVPPDPAPDARSSDPRPSESPGHPARSRNTDHTSLLIDRVVATDARVEMASSDPAKPPRVFAIHRLELTYVALDRPMAFAAALGYPRPAGDLAADGTLGPWLPEERRDTRVTGSYRFERADLGGFRGIGGLLHASGSFEGTLATTRVTGHAEVPDFTVTRAGHVVPLVTDYEVEVGGSGGNVSFRPVHARFLDSSLVAEGAIVRDPLVRGRTVSLDVRSEHARVEDLVRFAIDEETPPLLGDIALETRVEIPPGPRRVIERLVARGHFTIREGRFSKMNIQRALARLSRFALGESAGGEEGSVFSDLESDFELTAGRLALSGLTFEIPGMRVQLDGTYGVEDQLLDFRGRVRLERSLSQMAPERMSGWLQFLDPLLQRGEGGTVVPIRISGTRSAPSIRLDAGELKDGVLKGLRPGR